MFNEKGNSSIRSSHLIPSSVRSRHCFKWWCTIDLVFARISYKLVSFKQLSLLDSLFEETLTEFPEVLGHNTLSVLGKSKMDSFAKDLGRSMPFLDNAVDECLLNDKGIVPRQLASPSAEAKCKP